MLQKISTALFLSFLIFSCSQENQPFTPVNENFETTDLILPKEYSYSVLFQEEYDSVVTKEGKAFPAKGSHDLTVFIPDSTHPTTKGIIYISHESKLANSNLGDGGGATVFDIELINDHWEITSKFQDVDFSTVGGTYLNCGGSLSPNNTILTCEEADYTNNKRFYKDGKGLTDTSNIFDKPLWQNFGYVVEVDPNSKKALRKLKHMGRFVHEDAHCTKDGKTVYLSDDFCPAVFFKFVADTPFDYSTGQLYAFKQENQHEKGNWIKLPMDDSSLVYARDNAIALGATMFIRHEWIEAIDNKLYITETGTDSFNWNKHIAAGGTVPWYIKNNLQQDDSYSDKYGRVLEFDMQTNTMKVFIEGGSVTDGVFSNPDCNTSTTINGKNYLVLSEDIIGKSHQRVNENAFKNNWAFNEIYFVDLSKPQVTTNNLLRFAVAPKGAETTGVIFLPNGDMIINVQHPSKSNPLPFNRSSTILIERKI